MTPKIRKGRQKRTQKPKNQNFPSNASQSLPPQVAPCRFCQKPESHCICPSGAASSSAPFGHSHGNHTNAAASTFWSGEYSEPFPAATYDPNNISIIPNPSNGNPSPPNDFKPSDIFQLDSYNANYPHQEYHTHQYGSNNNGEPYNNNNNGPHGYYCSQQGDYVDQQGAILPHGGESWTSQYGNNSSSTNGGVYFPHNHNEFSSSMDVKSFAQNNGSSSNPIGLRDDLMNSNHQCFFENNNWSHFQSQQQQQPQSYFN